MRRLAGGVGHGWVERGPGSVDGVLAWTVGWRRVFSHLKHDYGVSWSLAHKRARHTYSHAQVPVRPYKHNEYERFLLCAYPYYASALSGMVAFFALGWFYLYHK